MTSPTEPIWSPNLRYPDPSVQVLDPSFAKYRLAACERRAALRPACAGARARSTSATRALRAMERHPEQLRMHALGRGDRRDERVPIANRPTTPTATRGTGRAGSSPASTDGAARHPHRVRRLDHGDPSIATRAAAQPCRTTSWSKSDGSDLVSPTAVRRILGYYEGRSPTPPSRADERLSRRRADRRSHRRRRRHQCAQRLPAFSPDAETKLGIVRRSRAMPR